MFELSKMESNALKDNIRCQNGILYNSWFRYAPFTFTELGVAMLSSVLNSKTAIEKNRNIMRAFVAMRQFILNPPESDVGLQNEVMRLKQYVEDYFTDQNDINEDTRMQLELLNESMAALQVKYKELNKPSKQIGFKI